MYQLKKLREEKGWNQDTLARLLNTSQSSVSLYEKGARSPDLRTALQIAQLFDVSIDYLVGLSDVRKVMCEEDWSAQEANIMARLKQLSEEEQKQVDAFILGIQAATR